MNNNNTIQWFLIKRFVVVMLGILASEYLVGRLIGYAFWSVVGNLLLAGNGGDVSIGGWTLVVLLFLSLFSMLAQGVVSLLPNPLSNARTWIGSGVERLADFVMESTGQTTLWQVNREHPLLTGMFLFVGILLLLIPFVIGAYIYAYTVIREFSKVQAEREAIQKKYDRKRNLMLSDIAHDLRTPITTVLGYAKALSDGMVGEERKAEYLLAIQNKSIRMNDLITLLFDYVKLDSEGFTMEKESLDLCELLRENAALLYADVEDAGMEFEIDIPEEPRMIQADRLQFSRVITNLLVNVLRHNGKGTKIGLYLVQNEDQVQVVVADSGVRIPKDMAEHLFDPFAKGDLSRSSGGSGLGLSIAKKVVEMHGWELQLWQDKELLSAVGMTGYTKAFVVKITQNIL